MILSDQINLHDVYIEIGKKKVFAVAVHWPGWCRWGKDESAAIHALFDNKSRYAKVVNDTDFDFVSPVSSSDLNIVARLKGNSTTDFGAPAIELPDEWELIHAQGLDRNVQLMDAAWRAFDIAVSKATGKQLRKGPRGGGRDLEQIMMHVLDAEEAYLKKIGWRYSTPEKTLEQRITRIRQEALQGLKAAAEGLLPREGPRGGKRWPPSFFVRRLVWHVVDHAWEIEDRIVP